MSTSAFPPESPASGHAATYDVGHLLDHFSWSWPRKAVVLLAALAIVFDGFDNQIVGFAIPAIVVDWDVARSAFGPVLAFGLIGMTCGTAIGRWLGDWFGRRVVLIGSVLFFGMTTIAASFASRVFSLTVLRFLAGTGLGGAMPNASTITAEFTPLARRVSAVTVTIVCVPLGGMAAGLVAAGVLPTSGWRTLFVIGGVAPLVFALLSWFLLPESPRFLARRPARWGELAGLMRRFGRQVQDGDAFADVAEQRIESRTAMKTLFGRAHLRDTLALWASFFCCFGAVYLVFSWLPTLLASEGLDLASASIGLSSYNFGGVLGALSFAVLVGLLGSRLPMLAGVVGGILSALLGGNLIQMGRSSYLNVLVLAMVGTFISLSIIRKHIPRTRQTA